jgi:hypothetical protein
MTERIERAPDGERPSTVRPDVPATELARRLRGRDLNTAVLTTPEGHLLGVARRADLEQHSHPAQ